MPIRADGRKRKKRIVSGILDSLRASISAWSKAVLARPPRSPVAMTRNGLAMLCPRLLLLSATATRGSAAHAGIDLTAGLANIIAVQLERIGGDVARRRIAVGPVASRNVVGLLARTARGAEGCAGVDHGVDLTLRQAEIDQRTVRVE